MEGECRICHSPADAGRPLRHPCNCTGTIRFVHDHCQLRWIHISGRLHCDVCRREISTRPLYADSPSASEIAARKASQIAARAARLVLPLLYVALAVQLAWAFAVPPLAALRTWRLALAGSYAEARRRLLSVLLSGPSILAFPALWAEGVVRARYGAGLGRCQLAALRIVQVSLWVVMADMALAFILAFVPFTLGRIILLCIPQVDYYASTSSILLIGYGLMFSLGTTFAGMYTFHQYVRGYRLVIPSFFTSLPDILFRGVIKLITVANVSLNIINTAIICPLLFAWSLDICTSEMFGATVTERFRLLFASTYVSPSLHWLIGCALFDLGSTFSRLHSMILRPGVPFHSVYHHVNVREPFYKFYFKKLPGLLVGIVHIAIVILVPIQIAGRLAPKLFPVDITYFGCPTKGTSFWPALQNYTDLLFGVLLLRFLIGHSRTLIYLERFVKEVMQYRVCTGHVPALSAPVPVWHNGASGDDAWSSVAQEDEHISTNDATDRRRSVAVHRILGVLLAWMTVVIFNSVVLIFPISVGRASLFAITRLPLAGGLIKSNDMLALAVGFGIISTIIAASRVSFTYMTSGRTHPLPLSRSVIVFLWFVIVPILIGLLVDLSLISPFTGPDDGVPVLDLFGTWFMGWLLLKVWVKWVHWPLTPFLAYLTVKSRGPRLTRAKVNWPRGVIPLQWFLRDIFVPVATRLLAALAFPYVLAKGFFPRFGYSAAANSAAYRLAWLGCIGFYVLCHLVTVFSVGLCDSINTERVIIGQRLEDVTDGLWSLRTLFPVVWL
uniref:Uncharacterized protein n=1 Tax=Avena sativa TaxID=4498 RepID=A0ACD5TZG2_AVESA